MHSADFLALSTAKRGVLGALLFFRSPDSRPKDLALDLADSRRFQNIYFPLRPLEKRMKDTTFRRMASKKYGAAIGLVGAGGA